MRESNKMKWTNEMRKKAYKVLLAVIVFAIVLLLIWFAGQNIGEDLGTFIYNIFH